MFCSNCGAEAEGNFCKNCGAPLPKEEPSTEKSNESIDAEYKVYDEEEDQKQKRPAGKGRWPDSQVCNSARYF